jgi:hypothetical protein
MRKNRKKTTIEGFDSLRYRETHGFSPPRYVGTQTGLPFLMCLSR